MRLGDNVFPVRIDRLTGEVHSLYPEWADPMELPKSAQTRVTLTTIRARDGVFFRIDNGSKWSIEEIKVYVGAIDRPDQDASLADVLRNSGVYRLEGAVVDPLSNGTATVAIDFDLLPDTTDWQWRIVSIKGRPPTKK